MKKLLILLESDSCVRESIISWPEKYLGAVVEHYGVLPGATDLRIQQAIGKHCPEVVAYCGTLAVGKPLIETLSWIKTQCRSVFIGFDAGSSDWQSQLRHYKQVFDLMVASDGAYEACVDVAFPAPINSELMLEWHGGLARDIDLGFWGGISPDENPRNQFFRQVSQFCHTFRKDDPPDPYSEYIRFTKRCWATLNSAWQGNPIHGYARHVKGRCIEAALGGSALFEAKGSPLVHWFEPGVDYFEFDEDRPRDILDVIRDPSFHVECTLRAERMYRKVRDLYGPAKFWATVLGEQQ